MRTVIQRVRHAQVIVDEKTVASIGGGMLILLGVGPQDTDQTALALARKISLLRIFEDGEGRINRSILETGGEAIVVSQFTLYADTRKGNRPSFTAAAAPDFARDLVGLFAGMLQEQGVRVQQGVFGAHMQVELENDGPVTIWMEY